jgi:hypothetical protein
VPKRHRVRARARRPVETAPQRVERLERERPLERARPRYRGAPLPPGGARAIGAPSAALEKAATLERTNVMRDLRRLGIVAGITFAVLLASGVAVSTLLR